MEQKTAGYKFCVSWMILAVIKFLNLAWSGRPQDKFVFRIMEDTGIHTMIKIWHGAEVRRIKILCIRDDTGINQLSLDLTGAYRSRIYTTLGSHGFFTGNTGAGSTMQFQNLHFRILKVSQASLGFRIYSSESDR
jgi:hypothetical protein